MGKGKREGEGEGRGGGEVQLEELGDVALALFREDDVAFFYYVLFCWRRGGRGEERGEEQSR